MGAQWDPNVASSAKYTLTSTCGNYQCARNLCENAGLQLAEPRSPADVQALVSFWGLHGKSAWLGFNHLTSARYQFNSDGSLVDNSFPYIGLPPVAVSRNSWWRYEPTESANEK